MGSGGVDFSKSGELGVFASGVQGASAPTCRNKSGLNPSRLRVVTARCGLVPLSTWSEAVRFVRANFAPGARLPKPRLTIAETTCPERRQPLE